jgi:arginine deiminase
MSPLNVQLRAVRALRDYNTESSQQQAANNNHINRNYLRRQIQGVPTRESVNAFFQTLSIVQESFLVDWAVIQGRLGYAPRVTYFQQFAERLLAIEGVPQQLGKC